eukprot:1114790-Prymnesium_polylepis.1
MVRSDACAHKAISIAARKRPSESLPSPPPSGVSRAGARVPAQALAQWERELFELPPGSPPSYDFTSAWVETFSEMGFEPQRIASALLLADWVDFEVAYTALLD